jgi:molybdopterin molybdotransferase
MKQMITLDEAIEIVLETVSATEEETVILADAVGRVSNRDIVCSSPIPPFDNSAMDGYAVISADTEEASRSSPVTLTIVEYIRAGQVPKVKIERGQASRIMTGAQVNEGADAVIMQEMTKGTDSTVEIHEKVQAGVNIRKAGEDMNSGHLCVPRGKVLTPADVGLIATVGFGQFFVYRRPVVSIVATGDELIAPDSFLEPGKIRNSNTYTLISQVKECGCVAHDFGIAGDTSEKIKEKLTPALSSSDMVITSGGVSVGDYDEVQDVLRDLGVELIFWKTKMKPGKPLLFGLYKGKLVFGVPGNPASSMVVFEEIIKPALLKMMGRRKLFLPRVDVLLKDDLRAGGDRLTFIRVIVRYINNEFVAFSSGSQSSGVLSSMASANGLVAVPIGQKILKSGQKVKAQILDWTFLSENGLIH